MTESAYSSIRGAEISERSTELVLPSSAAPPALDETTIREHASTAAPAAGWRTTALAGSAQRADGARAAFDATTASAEVAEVAEIVEPAGPVGDSGSSELESSFTASPVEGAATFAAATFAAATGPAAERTSNERGQALPGDRGPRESANGTGPRPSFWRRIALGRRSQALRAAQQEGGATMTAGAATISPNESRSGELRSTPVVQRLVANRDANRDENALATRANEAVERRIVEPLLQALVSVEAKLERSHVDLVGRSDQVEQRLTQLWDIEEQLGALGELQESVLHVTEQQRRLEAALVAQTRILRWLVGGIILSLAVAAFSVAFFLRVAR